MHNSLWGYLIAIAVGGMAQFVKDLFPDWPLLGPVLFWVAAGIAILATVGLLRDWRRPRRPDGHETDGAEVLRYLLHESGWAERELRHLNFRGVIDHLAEFRRGARYDGLHTSGIPSAGGKREPIASDHWAAAEIIRETASTPEGVCTKSSRNLRYHSLGYCVVKVRSDDISKVWPRASIVSRVTTKFYVWLKRIFFLWTRDARDYRRHQWNSIRDNVREASDQPQPAQWPDFDRWDKEPILRLYEAACLWCDEGPSLPMSSEAQMPSTAAPCRDIFP